MLRRRTWDRLTGWVLAALVLTSLILGVALWSGALWSQRAVALGPSRYVAADAVVGLDVAQALRPEWMILLYPDAGNDVAIGDPAGAAVVWGAVRAMLTALRPAQFAVGTHAGAKTVALAAAGLPRGSVGVEINLGSTLQWSVWDRALGGQGVWSGPNSQFDRIAILPGATPPVCSPAGTTAVGSPVVDFLTVAGAGFEVQVNPGDYCALLAVVDSQQLRVTGYAVAPVLAPATALPVAPGVLAPSAFPWTPVALRPEGLDPPSLAASIFPDPLSVVPRQATDGAFEFQNAADWSLTVTPSQAELVVPAPRAGSSAPEWDVGLAEALRYVDAHGGGWPSTAWLAWSRAQCTLTKCAPGAFEYEFATRYVGLPVLAPTGSRSAIAVQIVGGNGQPVLYTRDVPVPGVPLPKPLTAAMSAAQAVAAVAGTLPAGLLGTPTQVVAVFPAWAPLTLLTPAWAVEVDQGSAGTLETFLVDAYQGAVLGSWPPN